MDCTDSMLAADYTIRAKRNCSLSPIGQILFFISVFVVSMGIALGFALVGAWLILPFAGLELVALAFAVRHMCRHAGDYEQITICGDRLVVEILECTELKRFELNRLWAQVVLRCSGDRCRLALRSHGKELELGKHISDEQRKELARQLTIQLENHKIQFA
jgi:uncharacterized membrane protein